MEERQTECAAKDSPPHRPRPSSEGRLRIQRRSTVSSTPESSCLSPRLDSCSAVCSPSLARLDSVYIRPSTVSREVKRIEDLNRQEMVTAHGQRLRSRHSGPIHADLVNTTPQGFTATPPISRHRSLRCSDTSKRASQSCATSFTNLPSNNMSTQLCHSLPPSRAASMRRGVERSSGELDHLHSVLVHVQDDVFQKQPISRSHSERSVLGPKPRASFTRFATYDGLKSYQEEKAAWKRASMASSIQGATTIEPDDEISEVPIGPVSEPERLPEDEFSDDEAAHVQSLGWDTPDSSTPPPSVHEEEIEKPQHDKQPPNRFRHSAAEVGFCFTIAMTQFLAEYMISGFAIELAKLVGEKSVEGLGQFWPASLLSLILSATLLIFARISDLYGGYLPFMFGAIWLGIWSLVAGFAGFGTLLDVSRAMQGLAVAAFMPSTFAMVGRIYSEGPRKNIVLGLFSGCAPLGFFAGFLVAGSVPVAAQGWYFWIAAALSFITAFTAWLTVPDDRTDRQELKLKMDWLGAILITSGLILVSYALAVEPYANASDVSRSGWTFAAVLAPLTIGLACLLAAFWVEGWYASSPLLPFDFFRPRSVAPFSLACLCFYAAYGVWLYESAQFFQSARATGTAEGIHGINLAAWYTPTAVAGLVLCVVGGAILHIVPIMCVLLLSGLAWIGAPLLLALCPTPVSYWGYVMPSMLCATLGIDLTFTISIVFFSSVQPLHYQGLAGAVSSILVNLAMSFSLSISEIVAEKAVITAPEARREVLGFQAAFMYAAASAGLGLVICVLFVRISRSVVREKSKDKQSPRTSSEAPTLVGV